MDLSESSDNVTYTSYSSTPESSASALETIEITSENDFRYLKVDRIGTIDFVVDAIGVAIDTDNDGTANYLDLDSDEDGCFDALEGAVSLTLDDIDEQGVLVGDVDTNGVPESVSGGQANQSAFDDNVISLNCSELSENIYSLKNSDILLFPNPIVNELYSSIVLDSLTILDLQGKKIITFSDSQKFDLSGLASGVYIMKIKHQGVTYAHKLVKN